MKYINIAILFLVSGVLNAQFDFDSGKKISLVEEVNKISIPLPQPTTDKAVKVEKDWTVMVFMNAKNNLEQFGIKDMNEMEMIGSSDKVNIVVEFGRLAGYDSSNGDWKGVRRYYVVKDNNTSTVGSQMVMDLGEKDMGDYKNLADFIKWSKKTYPAKKYMLIVWNHGGGWEKSVRSNTTKGISYDDVSGNHMNTPQLGMALKEGGKIDVLGTDACLMGMAEVGYEIKDYVTYIVGSEETEPGDGYTYNEVVGPLVLKPTMGPADLAKITVDAYIKHYQAQGEGATQAYVRAEKFPDFIKAVNDFAYSLSQTTEKQVVKDAIGQAQSFAISDNKDFYDFVRLVSEKTKNQDVKTKSQALMTFIKDKLVAFNGYSNSTGGWYGPVDYSKAHGIAVYLPTTGMGVGYDELQWAKYTNWDEFIKWYQAK